MTKKQEAMINKWTLQESQTKRLLKENPAVVSQLVQILGPDVVKKISDQGVFNTLKRALVSLTPMGVLKALKDMANPQSQGRQSISKVTSTMTPTGMTATSTRESKQIVKENPFLKQGMKVAFGNAAKQIANDPKSAIDGSNFKQRLDPGRVMGGAKKELGQMLSMGESEEDDSDVFVHHMSDAEEAIKKATKAYKLKNHKEIGDNLAISKASVEDAEEIQGGEKDQDIELEENESSLPIEMADYGAMDFEEFNTDS